MLVLKRRNGDWLDVTCKCGNRCRFRTYDIHGPGPDGPGRVNIALDDDAQLFRFERPERHRRGTTDLDAIAADVAAELQGTPPDPTRPGLIAQAGGRPGGSIAATLNRPPRRFIPGDYTELPPRD